jgi:hypothetical protein
MGSKLRVKGMSMRFVPEWICSLVEITLFNLDLLAAVYD